MVNDLFSGHPESVGRRHTGVPPVTFAHWLCFAERGLPGAFVGLEHFGFLVFAEAGPVCMPHPTGNIDI